MTLFQVDIHATVTVEAKDETRVYELAEDQQNWESDDLMVIHAVRGSAIELDEDGEPVD